MADAVLLKIHREFTHDEAIKELSARLSASEFKVGELLSEVAELKDKKRELEVKLEQVISCRAAREKELRSNIKALTKQVTDSFKGDEHITNKIDKLKGNVKKLKEDVRKWQKMYFDLYNKTNKNGESNS